MESIPAEYLKGMHTMICNHCGRSNHSIIIETPCVTTAKGKYIWQKFAEHRNNGQGGQPENKTDSELWLFKIQDSTKSIHPMTVNMEINGSMEVDTGAAVYIVSQTTCQKLFSKVPIKPASPCL